MVFTKREKLIVIAAVAAVCLLALDVYVLTPLLEARDSVAATLAQRTARLTQARGLLRRRREVEDTWRGMLAGGMKHDPAAAESQLLRSLRDWSADVNVRLTSLRPQRSMEKTELPEIVVHAAGAGSMDAVSRLLRRIETAKIPVKIKMVQLGSRKEGTDDLSLHLRVSTLYLPEAPAPAGRAASRPTSQRGDR